MFLQVQKSKDKRGSPREKLLTLVTHGRLRREAGASYHNFGENAKN